MIRFPKLEQFGVTAVMSEESDGDCSTRDGAERFLAKHDHTLPKPLKLVNQVHGVHIVDSCELDAPRDADGIVSSETGIAMGVRVADCVPVLMYSPAAEAGAVVHAGREGTKAGIARIAVEALIGRLAVDVGDLRVQIGPSAGPCCYEVGEEMCSEFEQSGGVVAGNCLNLWETNRNQLIRAGVSSENIYISEICTICNDNFHSYRRNGTSSRNVALLGYPSR